MGHRKKFDVAIKHKGVKNAARQAYPPLLLTTSFFVIISLLLIRSCLSLCPGGRLKGLYRALAGAIPFGRRKTT
jgi:hypothetical protein